MITGQNLRVSADKLRLMLPESAQRLLAVRRHRHLWRKKKIIFIHIPKSAGTSVCTALYGRNLGHFSASDVKNSDPRSFEEFPMVAITRNPWDRLVSAYRYATRPAQGVNGISRPHAYLTAEFRTFESFIEEWLIARTLSRRDYVFRAQKSFLVGSAGEILPAFVGKVEKLEQFQTYVAQVLGHAVRIDRLNSSQQRQPYQKFYTPRTAQIVGELYSEDISTFDYDF